MSARCPAGAELFMQFHHAPPSRKRPRRLPRAGAETLTHRTTSIRLIPFALGRISLANTTKLCGNVVDSARSIDRVRASS